MSVCIYVCVCEWNDLTQTNHIEGLPRFFRITDRRLK